MTISTAQGQTFEAAGVHLGKKGFFHGQLYVACTRVSSPQKKRFVLARDGKIEMEVYRSVTTDIAVIFLSLI